MDLIRKKLDSIPKVPGCYLFTDKLGYIIYIGKSKSLRSRIRQHINTPPQDSKHENFHREMWDVSIIETESETEALILECALIKEHKPKYNSMMTRDRPLVYIRIDTGADYPTISIVEETDNDGSKYYGGFHNKESAEKVVRLMGDIWHTPICGLSSFQKNHRACLNYHMKKCTGPCNRLIDKQEYSNIITEIINCFSGDCKASTERLRHKMETAANNMQYEQAVIIRDTIDALKKLSKRMKRLNANLNYSDVFLFFSAFNEKAFTLFFIRNGIVLGKQVFPDRGYLDEKRLIKFVDDIKKGFHAENINIPARNLIEISADKYFLTASENWSTDQMVELLRSAYLEYIEIEKTEQNE